MGKQAGLGMKGRPCSIAAALDVVDGPWTFLIIRELTLGNRRFNVIATNTGCSRDILTARLRELEWHGVIYRQQYEEKPARYEYRLTESGHEFAVALASLRDWADRWLVDTPPAVVRHTCGERVEVRARCPHCEVDVDLKNPKEVAFESLTPGWSRTGPVSA